MCDAQKWVECGQDEGFHYDSRSIILCNKCYSVKQLYLVHEKDGDGDYLCHRCGKDVSPRHVCITCRNKSKSQFKKNLMKMPIK